jgi:flagellar hook-associated protein 1
MSSLFSSINSSLQSLLSQQQAIEVTEHNVANANTAGYHRQEAVIKSTLPYVTSGMDHSMGAGQIGSGVTVDQIKRFNSEYLNTSYRRQQADYKQYDTTQSVLTQVETSLDENGSGSLVSKMDDFWSSWKSLSNDPSNTSLRADLLDKAKGLAGSINSKATSLLSIQQDQNTAINNDVSQINTTATQIAKLNSQIANVNSTGDSPNDLLDERDRLLDSLSGIAGATSSLQSDGQAIVTIGGHSLVIGNDAMQVDAVTDANNNNLTTVSWHDGQSFSASTGELAGLLKARDQYIPDQLNGLNTLAGALISQTNTLHKTGFGTNGATGLNFFTGTDALSMGVSSQMDTLDNIATSANGGAVGDGSIALNISKIQDKLLMNGGTSTMDDYYNQQASSLGLVIKTVTSDASARQTVASNLATQRDSVSGVSTDEEATNLMKYQRIYQASAKVMNVLDSMLDTIINGLGAGR